MQCLSTYELFILVFFLVPLTCAVWFIRRLFSLSLLMLSFSPIHSISFALSCFLSLPLICSPMRTIASMRLLASSRVSISSSLLCHFGQVEIRDSGKIVIVSLAPRIIKIHRVHISFPLSAIMLISLTRFLRCKNSCVARLTQSRLIYSETEGSRWLPSSFLKLNVLLLKRLKSHVFHADSTHSHLI